MAGQRHPETWALIMATALGCTGGQSGHEGAGAGPTEFSEIRGGGPGATDQLTLCELVRHPMFEAGGLYRVDGLTGLVEEDLWNPGSEYGFTYVDLTLVDSWYQAEDEARARIVGGPQPDGTVGGWRVSLKVGEPVGLLLTRRVEENRGYYGLHELGTFTQNQAGGFSNGQLFTMRAVDAMELGDLVTGLAGQDQGADCPYDELPDTNAASDGGIIHDEDAGIAD